MSEAFVLRLVERYPHPTALARRARDASVFVILRRLEARGLLWRRRGAYRLTQRGRAELAMTSALLRLVILDS
jgi:DNA-binding PadR family transcriptional regulator